MDLYIAQANTVIDPDFDYFNIVVEQLEDLKKSLESKLDDFD